VDVVGAGVVAHQDDVVAPFGGGDRRVHLAIGPPRRNARSSRQPLRQKCCSQTCRRLQRAAATPPPGAASRPRRSGRRRAAACADRFAARVCSSHSVPSSMVNSISCTLAATHRTPRWPRSSGSVKTPPPAPELALTLPKTIACTTAAVPPRHRHTVAPHHVDAVSLVAQQLRRRRGVTVQQYNGLCGHSVVQARPRSRADPTFVSGFRTPKVTSWPRSRQAPPSARPTLPAPMIAILMCGSFAVACRMAAYLCLSVPTR
jgi:hypothetical protein